MVPDLPDNFRITHEHPHAVACRGQKPKEKGGKQHTCPKCGLGRTYMDLCERCQKPLTEREQVRVKWFGSLICNTESTYEEQPYYVP